MLALALAVAVVAIAIVAAVSDLPGPGAAAPAKPASRQAPAVAEPEPYSGSQSGALEQAPAIVDIFAPRTWQPAAAVPAPGEAAAATAVPPPPQAPALPFRLIGRLVEPGAAQVFLLTEDDDVLAVRIGDRIGNSYRVEKVEKGQLVFRYRPLNTRQTLALGDLR